MSCSENDLEESNDTWGKDIATLRKRGREVSRGIKTWPHSLPALGSLARALHRLDLTESQKVGNSLL